MAEPRGVLFVSYDGVLGGPGRSQTLPYLGGYREAGWRVHLLSYEKPELLGEEGLRAEVARGLEEAGVRWTVLPWRRSMAADLWAGLRAVRRLVEEGRPAVLHARSYVPALLCDLAGRRHGARLLFDMRGLWPDERVDGGLWTDGHPLHRLWKRLERRLLRRAAGVVVLSRAGADLLREEALLPRETPLEVIPCGADLERFRPLPEGERPAALAPFAGKRVHVFLGATGTWYLLDRMLDFAAHAVRTDPGARLLFLTEDPRAAVAAGLEARSIPADRFLLVRAPHAEVPRWLAGARSGVFFIRACRSKRASCPTKLAEFLACGVPVVVNDGVGDVGALVRREGVGAVVGEFAGERWIGDALRDLEGVRNRGDVADRCRRAAERHLDVRAGAAAFASLSGRLAGA